MYQDFKHFNSTISEQICQGAEPGVTPSIRMLFWDSAVKATWKGNERSLLSILSREMAIECPDTCFYGILKEVMMKH